jgi:DNA polymerase-3 subunit epsilon
VYLSMTRGQDTLVIDLAPDGAREDDGPIDASGLVVVTASEAELAAHEALLDGLEKANKAPAVWRSVAPAALAQSAV